METTFGLTQSDADLNLFIYQGKTRRSYVLVFIDNILIIRLKQHVDYLKGLILKRWKSKDLRAVTTFIKLQIERNRSVRTLRIHLSLYTSKVLERFGMANANGVSLPATAGTVLRNLGDDVAQLSAEETSLYQQITGSVIYLSN